jgi:hypothetical protein
MYGTAADVELAMEPVDELSLNYSNFTRKNFSHLFLKYHS